MNNLGKILLIGLSFLAPFSIFSATCSNKANDTCQQKSCCCKEHPTNQGHILCEPMNKGYNAPAHYHRCGELFFTASALYWQAIEDNLTYAITSINDLNNLGFSFPINSKAINP